jgi:uncharacterized protein YkwD
MAWYYFQWARDEECLRNWIYRHTDIQTYLYRYAYKYADLIKGTMNRTTNLFILLIVISFILPATAIRYAQAATENSQESNSTGNGQESSSSNAESGQQSNDAGNATSPSGSTLGNNTGNATADFVNSILSVHNSERAAHSIPALVWSKELAAEAKTWAEHIATTGVFAHDTTIFPAKGENIAWGSAGSSTEQLMQDWVNEKNKIQIPVTNENLYPVGHYVQMVSPATTHVGCGTANGGGKILVCRYDRSLFPQEPYIPSFLSGPAG